ncbi:MAG: hypothetical protein ACXWER_04495, partial [Halobacteriota archaeon]
PSAPAKTETFINILIFTYVIHFPFTCCGITTRGCQLSCERLASPFESSQEESYSLVFHPTS